MQSAKMRDCSDVVVCMVIVFSRMQIPLSLMLVGGALRLPCGICPFSAIAGQYESLVSVAAIKKHKRSKSNRPTNSNIFMKSGNWFYRSTKRTIGVLKEDGKHSPIRLPTPANAWGEGNIGEEKVEEEEEEGGREGGEIYT